MISEHLCYSISYDVVKCECQKNDKQEMNSKDQKENTVL